MEPPTPRPEAERPVKTTLIILGALGALLLSFIWWQGAGKRSVDHALARLRYDEVVAAVDRFYEQPDSATVAPRELTAVSRDLRRADEGVYLPTHHRFVEEDGLFILRRNSPFQPNEHGDPRFEKVRERLYRYHVSG